MSQHVQHHHPLLRRNSMPVGYRATERRTTPWNDVCDEILVPIGSLVAVFLAAAAIISVIY